MLYNRTSQSRCEEVLVLTTLQDVLNLARSQLEKGDRKTAAKLFVKAAETLEKHKRYERAAKIYEEAALVYRDAYMASECFDALEKAMVMLIRAEQNGKTRKEIVRINELAGKIAEDAEEYKRSAEYYFRAADFEKDADKRRALIIKAADALENEADSREMEGDYSETLRILKKVGRLYNSTDNKELGKRILQRAIRIAKKWAEEAKAKKNFGEAATALAEAAQILQDEGNNAEATRLLMDAASLYEQAGQFEKAGNTYDAAQEIYDKERLTTARKKAMIKASEAYMQMEGPPEVVAPLLVKAGKMFVDVQSPIKARWAFKRAADMFENLANKAQAEGDVDTANRYLRFQAMCLKNWGDNDAANTVYSGVIDHYREQATLREKDGEIENQAIALEEAAAVLYEAGATDEARALLEQALELYIQMAEDETDVGNIDEASRLYSKAAEAARNMGDMERSSSFHWVACEKAVIAAKKYEESGITELATVWYRTAGKEALLTNEEELTKRAIDLLRLSLTGFKKMNEPKEAFEDLFTIFNALWHYNQNGAEEIDHVLGEMQDIALTTGEEYMKVIVSILRHLYRSETLEAQQILQDNEKILGDKTKILHDLIEAQKRSNRAANE
ncbi:MAG: hypothetical protein ACTSYL_01105 [Candidatus Thorarchaeota archaeon]